MGPSALADLSVLSDLSVRASGRVTKNRAWGGAECSIFNDENRSSYG